MSLPGPSWLRFDRRALGVFLAILCVEVGIGLWIRDDFVRPWVGDALVVALLFYLGKSLCGARNLGLVCSVLALAGLVELGQLFDLVSILGLDGVPGARILLGATFDPRDLLAYSAGAAGVLLVEGEASIWRGFAVLVRWARDRRKGCSTT